MLQMNVWSLGWVIDSKTVRSVTCVSLSFPESVIHWDRWKDTPSGTGSSHWRDPAVPVLAAGLSQRFGPLVGLSQPSGQAHIPMQCFIVNVNLGITTTTCTTLSKRTRSVCLSGVLIILSCTLSLSSSTACSIKKSSCVSYDFCRAGLLVDLVLEIPSTPAVLLLLSKMYCS